MKRLRSVAVCSVAVLAMSVVLAASASAALPEFSGPFPKPFKSKSGTFLIGSVSEAKVTCTASTDTGEVLEPKNGTVVLRLIGCTSEGLACTSPGAGEGEIVTSVLATTLGYINKAKVEVGVALEATSSFAEFDCGPIPLVIRGSVIGKLTPIDKRVKPPKHFTLKFKPTRTGLTISIAGGPFERVGLSGTDEITFAETVEVKA